MPLNGNSTIQVSSVIAEPNSTMEFSLSVMEVKRVQNTGSSRTPGEPCGERMATSDLRKTCLQDQVLVVSRKLLPSQLCDFSDHSSN